MNAKGAARDWFAGGTKYLLLFSVTLLGALSFALSSCGGGGGGGQPSAPPFIAAELDSFPAGAGVPPGFTNNASVAVLDDSNGDSIATATVTMNGVPLTYDVANQDYEGNVVVAPGGAVALSVTLGGSTYTASGTQFTSYPTLLAPAPAATWDSSAANIVMWSGGAPTANAEYVLGILDAADPNGPLQWPDFLQEVPLATTSFSIPAFSIPAGDRLMIVGISSDTAIPNAAPGSVLVVEGFNYVPITVTGLPVTVRSSGTPDSLMAVTWSGSQFVAVGGFPTVAGAIVTSPDGITWTSRSSGTTAGLFGIASSGTQFVAVGGGAVAGVTPAAILSSPDGISWTKRTSGVVGDLTGVAWSGALSLFVAVGSTGGSGTSGTILTSPDGVTWTSQTSGTSNHIEAVTWSGMQFVAVGTNGLIMTSLDGKNWTQQTSGTQAFLEGVAWSGTRFVAVGKSPDAILTSPDGASWTLRSSAAVAPRAVAWSSAQSQFVAVGGNDQTGVPQVGTIQTSPDGAAWTQQASGTENTLTGIVSSGTNIVIVGGPDTVRTSP